MRVCVPWPKHRAPDYNMSTWLKHVYRAGSSAGMFEELPPEAERDRLRAVIEPWLSAVLQSEHLSLLLGSGFTTGVAAADGITAVGMGTIQFDCQLEAEVNAYANRTAATMGRGPANFEDQVRAALALLNGLQVMSDPRAADWRVALNQALSGLIRDITAMEAKLLGSLERPGSHGMSHLLAFLLSFASRAASRERLNLFTTNYDRLIEYGCDRLGLRVLDRFIGTLAPEFRSSRQCIDLHYNPPGIRGEPRFLEGVLRLSKLHGSIDWLMRGRRLVRRPLPFGASEEHSEIPDNPLDCTIIYPNPGKDLETLLFPYAELFRDFASALCQPNSTLVCYGYGFGDDHINRIIDDMLTIPSTHVVIVSWDDASGRIPAFCEAVGRRSQMSLLIGSHFGDLGTLVTNYLPKPAVDLVAIREATLRDSRGDKRVPAPALFPEPAGGEHASD